MKEKQSNKQNNSYKVDNKPLKNKKYIKQDEIDRIIKQSIFEIGPVLKKLSQE